MRQAVAGDGSRSRPIAMDLYAGAGGLSLGMEQAGFDLAAAAEFDPVHALTHRYNFPTTPVLTCDLGRGTVAEVAALLTDAAGLGGQELDAVVGGPPCQGFSVGGVRDAVDRRNDQFVRFVELVVALQPKVFCLENVSGLLESRFDELRDEALTRLRGAGYSVAGADHWVNAADFGVPQGRKRVMIMGSRVGPAPQLESRADSYNVVRDAFDGLPDISRYPALLRSDETKLRPDDLAALLGARSEYARRLAGTGDDTDDLSYRRLYDQTVLTNSLRTLHTAKSYQRFSRTQPGRVEKVSRLFRLDADGLARTLRAGTGADRGSHTSPRPIHPVKARVITVREAARLHGYPDWFRFHGTNWHGHRQVGNSVPPPLGAAAGRALIAALGPRAEGQRPALEVPLGDPAWLWLGRTEAAKALGTMAAAEARGVVTHQLAAG